MSYVVQTIHAQPALDIRGAGVVGVVFQNGSGKHPDAQTATRAAISQRVIPDLRQTDQWRRYLRLRTDLESIESQLEAKNVDATLANLADERERLIDCGDVGLAMALQKIDAKAAAVRHESESLVQQRDLLRPVVDSARRQVELLAKQLNDAAVVSVQADLIAEQNKLAEQLGAKAGDLVAKLITARDGVQQLRAFRTDGTGRQWVDAALSK